MNEKDIAIRVSGLLQAIINSGVPQEDWEKKLQAALILHSITCRKILGGRAGSTEVIKDR